MKKIIKISTAICGALLAVLGFTLVTTSCRKPPPPLYGMPPAEYISGKVTDKVTGEPIMGIHVKNWGNSMESFGFTKQDGKYFIPHYKGQSYLTFSDVDSEENGLYNDTIVSVDVRNIALTPKK